MTLAEALRQATARLARAGIEGGGRDARLILAHVTGIAADRLTVELAHALPEAEAARFEALIAARCAHQPVAQIVGRRAFWGRVFRVTRDVLDPRPETEAVIAAALELGPRARILDLGTGTGCLAVTLLAEWPDAIAVATDVSPAALRVAAGNALRHGVADRLRLIETDWFDGLAGRYDLVVSNPPYISADEMETLAPDVARWEPHLALTPGGDGLDAYRRIAADLQRFVAPGGVALLETGATQGPAVGAILRDGGACEIGILADLGGHNRVVMARFGQ